MNLPLNASMNTAVCFLPGLIIVLQNLRSPKNQIFFLFGLVTALMWLGIRLNNIFLQVLGASFLGPMHFHHLLTVFGKNRGALKKISYGNFLIAAIPAIFSFLGFGLGLRAAYGFSLICMTGSVFFHLNMFWTFRHNSHIAPYLASVGVLMIWFALTLFPGHLWSFGAGVYVSFLALFHYKLNFLDIFYRHARSTLILLIYVGLASFLLPLLLPALRDAPLAVTTAFFGFFFSSGTLLYAYAIHYQSSFRRGLSADIIFRMENPLKELSALATRLQETAENPASANVPLFISKMEQTLASLELDINTLLDLARVYEDKVTLTRTSVDLKEKIQTLLEQYSDAARDKGLTLSSKLDEVGAVTADESKIAFVFNRLLTNAIRFSTRGTITVRLHKNQYEVFVEVEDEGKGIRPADIAVLFTRRLALAQFGKTTGTLLALAQGWIMAHEGKIWADSRPEGQGTKITFTLPVR